LPLTVKAADKYNYTKTTGIPVCEILPQTRMHTSRNAS